MSKSIDVDGDDDSRGASWLSWSDKLNSTYVLLLSLSFSVMYIVVPQTIIAIFYAWRYDFSHVVLSQWAGLQMLVVFACCVGSDRRSAFRRGGLQCCLGSFFFNACMYALELFPWDVQSPVRPMSALSVMILVGVALFWHLVNDYLLYKRDKARAHSLASLKGAGYVSTQSNASVTPQAEIALGARVAMFFHALRFSLTAVGCLLAPINFTRMWNVELDICGKIAIMTVGSGCIANAVTSWIAFNNASDIHWKIAPWLNVLTMSIYAYIDNFVFYGVMNPTIVLSDRVVTLMMCLAFYRYRNDFGYSNYYVVK